MSPKRILDSGTCSGVCCASVGMKLGICSHTLHLQSVSLPCIKRGHEGWICDMASRCVHPTMLTSICSGTPMFG